MLWVDLYRPTKLSQLTYHKEQSEHLASLVKAGDFPHLLIYGPSGAGKKTRINCVLRELFGPGTDKIHLDSKSFVAPSGKKLEIQTLSSNYHIQLCPGDVGIYDRVVVQEVIKEMAQMQQLTSTVQRNFKVIVLLEADRLTRDAQHALRRTMEKYSATCRLILCCESLSRIIDPLRSRCLAIRVAAPSNEDLANVLKHVCTRQQLKLPDDLAQKILQKAGGNTRKALLSLEVAYTQCYPFKEGQDIPDPDWEVYLRDTARIIIQQQTPENILKVRDRLYECLSRCIPPNIIFVKLVKELLAYTDDTIKVDVVAAAAECEHRLMKGSKAIFHLEAFIVAFMDIYQKYINGEAMQII
ncbi:hypothetical protein AB6A40_000659 [Gnathostoma spinigerum]|uniref:Replication factor C subunit 3 n=1 Tax=Gnathostoma spinigerum TaxID=75299 RepID=A0ABD6ECC0_9BILA